MRLFSKRNFGLLFFAVVRFSPPSPKAEVVKRKAKAKNIRRIRKSRSIIFWLRPRAKPEAALWFFVSFVMNNKERRVLEIFLDFP